MRNTGLALAIILIFIPVVGNAGPIAIGDSVTVSWDFSAIGTPQCGAGDVKTTSVAADASDTVTVLDCISSLIDLSVDMNTSGFTSEWNTFTTLGFGDPFDGLVISNVDWLFTPSSLVVDTNLPGWSEFGVAVVTSDGMYFNFAGIDSAFSSGAYYFNVRAVPEPGTLALLGVGLLGMGVARRRKKA